MLGVLTGPSGPDRRADRLDGWPGGEDAIGTLGRALPEGHGVLALVLSGIEALDRVYARHGAGDVPDLSWVVMFRGDSGQPRLQSWVFDPSQTAFLEEMVVLE